MAGEDYTAELVELRHLQSIAKQPRVVSFISSEILRFEKLSNTASNAKPITPTPTLIASETKVASSSALNYVTLSSFSWEQDNDKVKLYVFLEGVDQEKMENVFRPTSIDLKFHDVQGKNYRCVVPKLNKEIVPESCKVLVKPTKLIITLPKASKGDWLDLHYKDDKLKPNLDKEKDPMAGVMNLMKNMYEEGDDDMKRTIAKAWTDARSGKTSDSLGGYR